MTHAKTAPYDYPYYRGGTVPTGPRSDFYESNYRQWKLNHRGYYLDRSTPAYARLVKAGFTLPDFEVNYEAIHGEFICVCGRKERYMLFFIDQKIRIINGRVDVAALLENEGAASVKHLKGDGYSKEQIMAIRRAFV